MTDTQEIQTVTFGLGAEIFAVPVTLVREILDYRETFRIPNGPDYLLGLTDMRGEGIATIDFRLRLGMPHVEPTPNTRILVVDVPVADRVLVLGLVVDRVLEVSTFRGDQIGAAPDIGVRWPSEYIAGVVKRTEGFVVLVDVARIFSAGEAALLLPISSAA
ncbi:chemotaxis protein CheW [Sphingomonas kyeonggiensis]|uniref:Purine-binding chemotaxis protein CheW n=1 Tax=Sphingomonas kyeonggiensis TaxID=1268553 RepID=A0A7W6JQC1_9SPHN|nr:chemotaxis protein CheW [Sphingomonas kyeonggiensis]MBB4097619.1 purine-binding chemotaxis protein CheW [Sphingomonas kyeonggiensis]